MKQFFCVTVCAFAVVAILVICPRETPTNELAAAEPASAGDVKKVRDSFLQKHCVSCHGAIKPKGDIALHKTADDAALLKDRKMWASVIEQVQSGEMPPKEKPRPTRAEREAFVKAVNGVFDRVDKNAKPDPGRVTVRRLNKVEYNNTIRDLLLVNFDASEDFPSDDIGHGFDNIGDVLTLSPVLMERYLAAAENIANRAIVLNPPKPPVRQQHAQFLEPAGPNVPKTNFRPITVSGPKGMLHSEFRLTKPGENILRIKCYGKQLGDEPIKIALLVDGKELKTFEVKATEEKKAEVFEARVTLPAGDHRGAVQFLNEFKKDKDERTLLVNWLSLEGPLDTRPLFQQQIKSAKPQAGEIREFLTRFVSRAFRRPAAKEEVERLAKLVEAAMAKGEKWEAGMQMAIQAVLVSPKFLFRLELDDRPSSADAHAIDEYQLASRLSYFLWSSMPDDELFALAEKKQLTANLDAQVKRMLKDPKATALVDNFFMQWLQLRRLKLVQPDAKDFPQFNDRVREGMLKETRLFLEEIVREDHSILDMIDGKYTYLNGPLASVYGIKDTKGNTWGDKKPIAGGQNLPHDKFVRVELPPNSLRGGILTQASVLTVTSNPTRTSPVKRGRWVLEQILGTPPPPPPPDVPELNEKKGELKGTLRQRMEQHRVNPACANCHAKMDPIGFALENFNAIGAYRWQDGGANIDPSGTLPDGKSFKGPEELKQILKEKKDLFSRCLTEKMLTYAVGRGLEFYDKRVVDAICGNLANDNYKFSRLVAELVKSEPFRMRRGNGKP